MLKISILLGFICQGMQFTSIPRVSVQLGPFQPQQDNSPNYMIYDKGVENENFNYQYENCDSCQPSDIPYFKVSNYQSTINQQQDFSLQFNLQNYEPNLLQIRQIQVQNLFAENDLLMKVKLPHDNKAKILWPGQTLQCLIVHKCPAKITKNNYWTMSNVTIIFSNDAVMNFQYQFLCDPDFHPARFDLSLVVMVIFASIIVLILARFGVIYSFKIMFRTQPKQMNVGSFQDDHVFQGILLGLKMSLFCIICVYVMSALSIKYEDKADSYLEIITIMVVGIFSCHFINEVKINKLIKGVQVLCLFSIIKIIKKKILFLRLCDWISITITVVVITLYFIYRKPWYLSDLMSIFLMGSFIKLFKLASMKDTLYFSIPLVIASIGGSIYMSYAVRQEWDNVALRYYNTPFSFQIPLFQYIYKKKCVWISVLNFLLPGFIQGLAARYDACKSTFVYEIISFFGLISGLLAYVFLQILANFPLPVAFFTVLPQVGSMLLLAYSRHEHSQLMSGNFYDESLYEPYKNNGQMLNESTASVQCFCGSKDQQVFDYTEKQDNVEIVRKGDHGGVELNQEIFKGLGSVPEQRQNQQQSQQSNQQSLFSNQKYYPQQQPFYQSK